MVQVIEMTDEEKFKIYMNTPHEQLVRMKIEEEKILKRLEKDRPVHVYVHDNTSTITASTDITFDELLEKVHVSTTSYEENDKSENLEKEPSLKDLYDEILELKNKVETLELHMLNSNQTNKVIVHQK